MSAISRAGPLNLSALQSENIDKKEQGTVRRFFAKELPKADSPRRLKCLMDHHSTF